MKVKFILTALTEARGPYWRSFYREAVDEALAEIDALPGRHLFFLDDHLFGDPRFAAALFDGMRGMGRVWQAAGTVAVTFHILTPYPGTVLHRRMVAERRLLHSD